MDIDLERKADETAVFVETAPFRGAGTGVVRDGRLGGVTLVTGEDTGE